MPAKNTHFNFAALSYGRGALREPNSVLMRLQSPIIKRFGWTCSIPSRGEKSSLGFPGSPTVWKWPNQLSLHPVKVSRSSRIQHGQSIYSFYPEKQTLVHMLFQVKSRLCVFVKGSCRTGCLAMPMTSWALPLTENWSWSWHSNNCRTRMSRGLGSAQTMIGGGMVHLFCLVFKLINLF